MVDLLPSILTHCANCRETLRADYRQIPMRKGVRFDEREGGHPSRKEASRGISGCLEHATMIWEAIQRRKSERLNLDVEWLDLANAY